MSKRLHQPTFPDKGASQWQSEIENVCGRGAVYRSTTPARGTNPIRSTQSGYLHFNRADHYTDFGRRQQKLDVETVRGRPEGVEEGRHRHAQDRGESERAPCNGSKGRCRRERPPPNVCFRQLPRSSQCGQT